MPNLKTKSLKTIIHYNQSGTYLWAKGGGGAKDSHIICSAALESILNVDVATVNGGPWRKGTGGSVAYGWGTSKGPFIYYVSTFPGFFDPHSPPFTSKCGCESKHKLHVFLPLLPKYSTKSK